MSDAASPISVETLLRERPWVEALARSLVRDGATADDVVQETWLAALQSPPPTSSLRGWLSRVVRNEAVDSRRRAERRERWEAASPARAAESSPAEVVAKAEAHRRVVEAVMSLDEPYRAAVLLRFFEGLESDDVARRTGVPVETARTRIKRALALLRGRLDRDHGGDGRAWALALLPLTGAHPAPLATGVTGGAAVAVSIKTVVASSVAAALLGMLVTRATMSAPVPEDARADQSAKETAEAPRPVRRERRASAQRDAAPIETSSGNSSLARAIDEISVDVPSNATGVISGHVRDQDGKPLAGILVRASAGRPGPAPRQRVPAPVSVPTVEESVRAAAVDAKWRAATSRTATTDAEGAYSLKALVDAEHRVEAVAEGCAFVAKGDVDPERVRPGITLDFFAGPIDVPIVVLMPDATPATETALIRFAPPEGVRGVRPMNFKWTPASPVAPVLLGTWTFTAEIGTSLKSPGVVATMTVGAPAPTVTLRLDPAVALAARITKDPQVFAAFEWLQRHQAALGGWGDAATTGIALLSFLGAGESHQQGSFREEIKNGAKYLRDHQDAEGCLVERTSPRWLRDHAVAGLALTEAYGMTQSRVYKEPAQRAVAFSMKARSSGWPAAPGGDLDIETTAWMVMTAKSAAAAEIEVDKSVFDDVVASIDKITDRATGRVVAPPLSDEAATAVGVLARFYAGRSPKSDEMIRKGADFLAASPPSATSGRAPDYAAWYFGTLALFQVGEQPWRTWNAALKSAVLDRQRTAGAGDDQGSWDAGSGASDADRVWATAFSALCSEVYLRFGRAIGVK